MSPGDATRDGRLITFEAGDCVYALPISGVLEVVEVGLMARIPTLPAEIGGAINYHGDALPVFRGSVLLDGCGEQPEAPRLVLVVTDRPGRAPRLGLPVDRVLGLAEGRAANAPGPDALFERREVDGRVAGVLDPQRLVDQARTLIEGSLARSE